MTEGLAKGDSIEAFELFMRFVLNCACQERKITSLGGAFRGASTIAMRVCGVLELDSDVFSFWKKDGGNVGLSDLT